MKQINLKLTAVNWKNSIIEARDTTARTCFHYKAWKAHAQLHLSRVGLCDLHNEIFSPTKKYWEFHQDNRNFKKRKTNRRKSVLSNKHSCILKSTLRLILSTKITIKDHDVKKSKSTKGYHLGWTREF